MQGFLNKRQSQFAFICRDTFILFLKYSKYVMRMIMLSDFKKVLFPSPWMMIVRTGHISVTVLLWNSSEISWILWLEVGPVYIKRVHFYIWCIYENLIPRLYSSVGSLNSFAYFCNTNDTMCDQNRFPDVQLYI